MFEPVNPGWSTPAWGEFGAWRQQPIGRHVGLDYYVPRGTPLFASGDGTVEVVSFHSGGHGHFCIIRYSDYRVSVSHMLERPTITQGQKVTARTRIGTVGQSGNAEGIVWQGLIHCHVEVRRTSNTYIESPRRILQPLNRSTLSGGGTTPIPIVPEVEQMKVYKRNEGGDEWMIVWPPLAGESTQERGYVVTTNTASSSQWEKAFGKAEEVTRDTYVGAQREARALHFAYRRGLTLGIPAASPSDGSFTAADRERLAAVPTAAQNGLAARQAIVRD